MKTNAKYENDNYIDICINKIVTIQAQNNFYCAIWLNIIISNL